MRIILKILLYMATCVGLILFALDWMVYGKYIPQAGNLGLLGYIGLVAVAGFLGMLLEGHVVLKRRR